MSQPPPHPPSTSTDSTETYNRLAGTVGMLPTLRARDNLIQAVVVLIGTILGGMIGYFITNHDVRAAALGAAVGLVASGLVTGFALIILGWRRARR
jgi:hypothetical protein